MTQHKQHWMDAFQRDGFALVPDAIDSGTISKLIDNIEQAKRSVPSRQRGSGTYAVRNLLEVVPVVRTLAGSTLIRSFVEPILGHEAFVVRGLLFDKTPEANWKVTWHQDLTIAVQQRKEVPDFGPWSVKAGVQHVQPPVSILERMLTLRLHLDDCGENNGPLRVLPGSHLAGRLSTENIQTWRGRIAAVACTFKSGGLLLMRPLLLHASSMARKPDRRRIVHLEFVAQSLPGNLQWSA